MKSLVLLSGGIDSTTCMYHLVHLNHDVRALSFFDRHKTGNFTELECAKQHSSFLRVPHTVLDVTNLHPLYDNNPRTLWAVGGQLGGCCKLDHEYAKFSVTTMLVLGMMFAANNGLSEVYWSLHQDDLTLLNSSDIMNLKKYIENISSLEAGVGAPRLVLPFLELTKKDVVLLSKEYDINLDQTFSCSNWPENKVHCGYCPQCQLREKAIDTLDSMSSDGSVYPEIGCVDESRL